MENADWPTQGIGRMREKSVVITGAAKGIGRATAELFAREGARLVVTDVEEVGLGGLSERLAPRERRSKPSWTTSP
jgi:NAD(P)-dependent dehydrogenase (short-subunit alcohol dehydrogenase family)